MENVIPFFKRTVTREDNIQNFKDTENLCKTNLNLQRAISKSNENQKLILENEEIFCEKKVYENPAKILVTPNRTFEAAMNYPEKKVAVLNFASATNPGGGVVYGSFAQEECLCRCSTLYFNLTEEKMHKGFYLSHIKQQNPLHNDDIIYTPEVVIFKTDTSYPKLMKEENWKSVNVITCAAPNLREKPSNIHNSGDGNVSVSISDNELQLLHEKRGAKILDVALAEKNQVVILGAFGCGAFRNKPEIVAKAYKNLIEKYKFAFETIEFAVYCSPRDDSNYRIFKKILEG